MKSTDFTKFKFTNSPCYQTVHNLETFVSSNSETKTVLKKIPSDETIEDFHKSKR